MYREMHRFPTGGGTARQTIGTGKAQNISVRKFA
jgi:hypothetical protein